MEEPTFDSGLLVRAPCARVSAFVSQYWLGLDNRDDTYDIVPDGCIDVVLHRQGGKARVWAYGTATRLNRVAIEPGDYLGIRFRPGMARFFLDLPAHELTDRCEAAPAELVQELEPLFETLGTNGAFGLLDRALERRLARAQPRPSAVDAAARSICASHGAVRIEELAHRYGKSRRQLEREFRRCVGISAKHLAVIARLRHAAARVASPPAASLADIALDAGYADQSHMARDFRKLTGASPSAWAGRVAFVQDP
jgi:AraC-like DNA-binding protein